MGGGQYTVPLSVSPDNHSSSPFSSPLAGESFLLSQDESREKKIDPLERQRQASAENIAALGEFSRLVHETSNREGKEGGQNKGGVSNREGANEREGSVRGGIEEKKDAGPFPNNSNNNNNHPSNSTNNHPSNNTTNNNRRPSNSIEALDAAQRVDSAVATFLHSHPEEQDHLRQVQSSLGPSAAVDRMLALQHENER